VLAAYVIALLAATGLFYVYTLHATAMDPIIGVEQVVGEKYRITLDLSYALNYTADRFHIQIPDQFNYVFQYVDDMGFWFNDLKNDEAVAIYYSGYVHLVLASGFGLIICATVTAILFALTKQRCVPSCSIFLIILATLLIWIFISISGTVSLILAKECNNGLDNLTRKYIVNENNTDITDCVRPSLNHYLFCEPWKPSSQPSCENPIAPLEIIVQMILKQIPRDGQYDDVIATLNNTLIQLVQLDSCNETVAVYQESKQNICFDVNNAAMQISLLYIIQSPILIVLLLYILFGWYRFNFQRLPFVTRHNKHSSEVTVIDGNITDKNEELESLGLGSDVDDDNSQDTSLLQADLPSTKSVSNTNQEVNVRYIIRKNKREIIFTGIMFLVVFLMIFVWFGILGTAFEVHANLC